MILLILYDRGVSLSNIRAKNKMKRAARVLDWKKEGRRVCPGCARAVRVFAPAVLITSALE